MKNMLGAGLIVVVGMGFSSVSNSAQAVLEQRSIVGELRQFALAPGNQTAIDALHMAGWIEADGRVLKQTDYPQLYSAIGRSWTSEKVNAALFAVPDLVDHLRDSPNPYGVLGPGDLTTGGRQQKLKPTPASFIFAGRSADR
jgi:hypothetical protein